MKTFQSNFRASAILFISFLLLNITPASARKNNLRSFQQLLTGQYGIGVAFSPVPDSKMVTLSFRHNLGGYARMLLVIRHIAPDGVTQDIPFECNGFPLNTLNADGANTTLPAEGSFEIVSLHLVFTRFGEQYILDIDESRGRTLTKSGQQYNYEQGLALVDKLIHIPAAQVPTTSPVFTQAGLVTKK